MANSSQTILVTGATGSKSYVPPFELGKPMSGGAVGEVVESRTPEFKPGDAVTSRIPTISIAERCQRQRSLEVTEYKQLENHDTN